MYTGTIVQDCNEREVWLNWLAEGEQEYTRSGKRKSASYEMFARWVSESWKALPSDLIRQSFIQCGILSSKSEDLHSRLRLLNGGEDAECESHDPTGLTDDEDTHDPLTDEE